VTLRARWVTLRARWVTLRARWVTPHQADRSKSLAAAANYIQMELELRKAGKELDFARRDLERTKADLRFHLHDRTFRQVRSLPSAARLC
jgi:hypothetical protein